MKREYMEQLACWFREEIEGFKVKGASEEIFREPAFTSLLVETVFQKTLGRDPFRSHIRRRDNCCALPDRIASELRKMAAQDRAKGKPKFAYYLEAVAEQRERGEFA